MSTALKKSLLAAAVLSLAACGGQESRSTSETTEVPDASTETATASVQPGADVDGARISAARSTPEDWLTYGGTYDEQRHSLLTKVNTDNVGKLGVAWTYELSTEI